jgi:general secretion pathway protein J
MTPVKTPCSPRSAGFTLIELLVALILLSFVFLLLTSGLQLGTKVWSSRDEDKTDTSEILAVQDFLRGALSEIRPVMIEADQSHMRHVYFAGNENAIRFVASIPRHLGVGGLYEMTVHLAEGDASGNRIEVTWQLYRPTEKADEPTVAERRVVLIDKVAQIQFAYFGYQGQKEPARWYDSWQDLQYLPQLIRINVTFSQGGKYWPDFVVAPMARSLNISVEPE